MASRARLCGLFLASALLLACNGQTASSADAGKDAHAAAPEAAVDDAGDDTTGDDDAGGDDAGDGGCVTPGEDAGFCTFCDAQWYCYGSAPLSVCPDDGGGECSADAAPCFVCSEGVEGYVCYCQPSDDGGEADGGLTWQCQSNEQGCAM